MRAHSKDATKTCARGGVKTRARGSLKVLVKEAKDAKGASASSVWLLAMFAAGAGLALGCGWTGTARSVRFNFWHSERQFSRLPPLPFDAREKTTREEGSGTYDEETSVWYDAQSRKTDEVWASAETLAASGEHAELRKLLREYLDRTGGGVCRESDAPDDCRARRNSARDQLDALASLDRGASTRAVSAYVEARRTYDRWLEGHEAPAATAPNASGASAAETETQNSEGTGEKESGEGPPSKEAVAAALERVAREPQLEDNVAYLRAALLYRSGEGDEAASAFERLAARFPRSEKREAALYNVAVIRMHASRSFNGDYALWKAPCGDCRDEGFAAATAAFTRLLREHPRGAYASDARGWLAYLRLRVGDTAEGLAEYYRMLADDADAGGRDEAVRSLAMTRGEVTEEDMARVEALIEDEPRAALAYAYHEIYNFATRDGYDVEVPEARNPYRYCKNHSVNPCWSSFYEWEEGESRRLRENSRRKTLSRVAAFATRLMLGGRARGASAAFALRVAQADLELGEDKSARELAARALAAGPRGNERASALWVRGVAEYRTKDLAAARRTFESLLEEFPEGDLSEGARRYVAMVAEDAGDLEAALEQYLALDYAEDVAYFVDVLMTTEQLASFVERHEDSPARDTLLYSLGVRLMRDHRFDEARSIYARVRTTDKVADPYTPDRCEEPYPPRYCDDPKSPEWDEPAGVRAAWVMRDLKTMDELERLEARAATAAGDEAKAEALYQLASHLYQSSDLTFYNPAAWRRKRFYVFFYDQTFRAPGEAQLMRRYMEEHEPVVRALKIYLQVAEDYPRTRAARDALYTAAVIHDRLEDFQLYWPSQYGGGLHPGQRLVYYDDVKRTYPDYPLPSGTYGWEPLTRTVNGHDAWPAPQKPRRLTGMERARLKIGRAERRVGEAWALFGEVYGGRAREWTVRGLRWTLAALVAAFALLAVRRTRRTRRFLYRQVLRRISRGRASRVKTNYAPRSSYAAHVTHGWGAGLCADAADAARALVRLALHERGRAALALNVLTHGLLTLLLWSLVWAAR